MSGSIIRKFLVEDILEEKELADFEIGKNYFSITELKKIKK